MSGSEEEIYSIMFASLKHPVRRKILRMLADKPLTFTEMVAALEVSTPNLTYHLESLGELVYKMDNGQYKLSSFGVTTVSAMKGVEEVPEIKSKYHLALPLKWKALFAALLICVVLLASMSTLQYVAITQLSTSQNLLKEQNQQLLAWSSTNKVSSLIRDVAQIDISKYTVTLLSNTLEYRADLGANEEVLRYALTSSESNLDAVLRFRNNHFSHYQLNLIESSPIYTGSPSNDLIENAKVALDRYKAYSGDEYLTEMSSLLNSLNKTENTEVTQGNIKLRVTVTGSGSGELLWMYTENGIDFEPKGLRMTFENHFLKEMTDGYFFFTVGSSSIDVSKEEAVAIAKSYVKTLSSSINGTVISGFSVLDEPVSVEFAPHPRPDSTGLVPYWYVVMRLDKVYVGNINTITVGIYADTGQVAHIQLLSE
jgi:DNA-binding transcriptional ArsR family regulator